MARTKTGAAIVSRRILTFMFEPSLGRYSTARVSKRPIDQSAACLRARYSNGVIPQFFGRYSIEIIQQRIRHQLDADDQALIIDVEFRRVDHGGEALLLVSDAEEVKESRNDLLIARKIFRAHLRLWRGDILLSKYFSHHRQSGFDQRRIVVSDRVVGSELNLVTRAVGRRHPGQRLLHHLDATGADLFVERAHRAFELHLVGDDVEAVAAVDAAERDDERLLGVDAAAADGLERRDAFRRDDNRVNAAVRVSPVNLLAANRDREPVR